MKKLEKRLKAIKLAASLNISFTVFELIGGLLTNSLAIISDALHDFGDSIALITALILEKRAMKKPTKQFTYGYRRLSLFSAIFAALILLIGSAFIIFKAIERLIRPEHVNALGMFWLAIVGIIFNGIGFIKLRRGKSVDEKVLSLHLLEDVLGWVAIIIGSIIILIFDFHRVDPILTLVFTLFILINVVKNLRVAFKIILEAVPPEIDLKTVEKEICKIKGVVAVHDLHIWSLEGETNLLSCHIVVKKITQKEVERVKKEIRKRLKKLGIAHSTLEIERKNKGIFVKCKCSLD